MLLKSCIQYVSIFRRLSSGQRAGKGQFSFQFQRRAVPKNVQTTAQLVLISHASKIMLKILQARLQQYMNWGLPDVQAGFRKGRESRDQIANICWIIEQCNPKKKNPPESNSALLAMLTLLCRSQQTGKFLKRWKYQTTLPVSWDTCMQVKKQLLELHMEQRTGSKLGKEYKKALYIVTLLI